MPDSSTYTAFLLIPGRESEGKVTGPHPLQDGKPAPSIREIRTTADGERRVATYDLSESIGAPSLYEYTLVSDEPTTSG
ncbi:hypothetical protein [Planctomonas psychrotolerans]|uniref:hypothetical protein n=1 Tax=Planctomonas psychrotolerans TaxID=2528712 RepID=UPI001239BC45|nr:hypothetical protein [Planctomonas psychrotolerans]